MARSPVSDSTQVPGYSSDPNEADTLFNGIPMQDFAFVNQNNPEYGTPPAPIGSTIPPVAYEKEPAPESPTDPQTNPPAENDPATGDGHGSCGGSGTNQYTTDEWYALYEYNQPFGDIDKSDDIHVGYMKLIYYGLDTTYGDIEFYDENMELIQNPENFPNYDYAVPLTTRNTNFGTLNFPESIIDKPAAKYQIPEIAAKATQLAAKLAQFYATGFGGLSFEVGDRTDLLNLLSQEGGLSSSQLDASYDKLKNQQELATAIFNASFDALDGLEDLNRIVLDSIPFLGATIVLIEANAGENLFNGEELSKVDRVISVLSTAISVIPVGRLVGALGRGAVTQLSKKLGTLSKLLKGKKGFEKSLAKIDDAIKRIDSELNCALKNNEPIHNHHSNPKFMGGDKKQPLTKMTVPRHKQLHKDLNDFLRQKTDSVGNHMRPQRGNSGKKIRRSFSPRERLNTIAEFYKEFRLKYPDAARDFFKQHPHLE